MIKLNLKKGRMSNQIKGRIKIALYPMWYPCLKDAIPPEKYDFFKDNYMKGCQNKKKIFKKRFFCFCKFFNLKIKIKNKILAK